MRVFDGFDAARGVVPGCAVALGNFDGVHLGHRALFAEAIALARARGSPAVVATFDPHPGRVLAADLAPKMLTSLSRKLQLVNALGLDAAVVQRFGADYAASSPDQFLERDLFAGLSPAHVVIGYDFTFGRSRAGGVEAMREACERRMIGCSVVPAVACDGVVISSTRIREFVAEGRVLAAGKLLGRPFDLLGQVEHGVGRGHSIGFPTANLRPESEVLPAQGVYAVRVYVGDRAWPGAANVGQKPTFGDGDVTVEVHLLGYEGDLYGARIGVEFLERLRGEHRFASARDLAAQITDDCARARELASSAPDSGVLAPWPSAPQGR